MICLPTDPKKYWDVSGNKTFFFPKWRQNEDKSRVLELFIFNNWSLKKKNKKKKTIAYQTLKILRHIRKQDINFWGA